MACVIVCYSFFLRFVTGHGVVLELGPDSTGQARCVGPRRLVLEGHHPKTQTPVRVELLIDEPEAWVTEIGERLRTWGGASDRAGSLGGPDRLEAPRD